MKKDYPDTIKDFEDWIKKYWDLDLENRHPNFNQKIVYNISFGEKFYKRAIIDYIAGMTDNFAIKTYSEICSFK